MYGTLIIADIRPKLHSKLHKIEDTTSEKKIPLYTVAVQKAFLDR